MNDTSTLFDKGADCPLPAVVEAPKVEAPDAEPAMELLLAQQDLIEIGRDKNGGLIIRQRNWPEDDTEIYVNHDYVDRFIDALTDFIGIQSFP